MATPTGGARALHLLLLTLVGSAAATPAATGIVVHGYHCQAHAWDEVVWGDVATQRLGRLPQAALLAWEMRHELSAFICGTGASRAADGTLEADATVAQLFERLPSLAQDFDCFHDVDLDELANLLRRTVITDTLSTNTEQEVTFALERLQRSGVRHAVLVSSPTHMPRCLRDACAAAASMGYDGRIVACPCATSWTAQAPVVLEPSHRPDREQASMGGDSTPFYELASRATSLAYQSADKRRQGDFLAALHILVTSHEATREN